MRQVKYPATQMALKRCGSRSPFYKRIKALEKWAIDHGYDGYKPIHRRTKKGQEATDRAATLGLIPIKKKKRKSKKGKTNHGIFEQSLFDWQHRAGPEDERKPERQGSAFPSSLATSRRYRDNNGEQKEETTWHNIVIWGKAAETFEQLGIGKGISLFIEGELVNRSWTDNQGSKRSITEVSATSFQILTPRGQGCIGRSLLRQRWWFAGIRIRNRNPYAPGAGTQQASEEDLDGPFPF